jgi:hypothetical protein
VNALANTCPWNPTGRLLVVVEKVTRVITTAPAGCTVTAALPWTPFAAVAVMVTGVGDGDTPVTRPEALTVATPGFEVLQVKVVGDWLPCASVPTAENATVEPTLTVATAGVTVTVVTGPAGGAPTALLRGLGAPVVKSARLLSVSWRPSILRSAAVVLLRVGVGAFPSAQFVVVPKPTKSSTAPPSGQAVASASVARTSATFPAVALIGIVPVASGVGSGVVPPAPCACCTR